MSMTKYGTTPDETSKTASGCPGCLDPSTLPPAESLKEALERKKREDAEKK